MKNFFKYFIILLFVYSCNYSPVYLNMSIEINLKITKNKIMMKEKIFNENISYNNTSSQFKLKQTEDKFENSLIRKISEDILIYLRSIEK